MANGPRADYDRQTMTEGSPTASSGRDPFGLEGETIGEKYRVTQLVGQGGFGVVYRGVHSGFGEPIAVKCLRVQESLDEEARDALLTRLQDEGRLLHRLSKLSNGIVQALDVGAVTTPKGAWVPYLVMEWLEGETLAEHLDARREQGRGGMTLREAVTLLTPAAKALAIAHEQGVAHRDVKPENLFLTDTTTGRGLKVLDFGIAKVLTGQAVFTAAPAATQRQPTAFTPSYGAPEQFNKKRGATGPWTDVFALALIVVELVSGERALDGDDATQLYVAAADPASRPTLRHHGVQTTDAVDLVLMRALAVEPGGRYQDAGGFWEALEAALEVEPLAPTMREPSEADVSATGDFVRDHDLEVPLPETPPAKPVDPDDAPAGEARASAMPSTKRSADESADEAPREEPSARALRRRVDETRTTDTFEPDGGASRWTLPVVVILALVGAGLVYNELRQVEPSDVEGDSSDPRLPVNADAATTAARPKTAATPTARATATAGEGGARATPGSGGAGGGDAAEGGGDTFEPPVGMVYVSAGKFFIDVQEVTAGAYARCTSCVPAGRITLTPEALSALGIEGDPMKIKEAWEGRCNTRRGKNDHPVNCVKHDGALDYCQSVGKRLPTSLEWTQAALGEPPRKFPWGDRTPTCETACFGLNSSCLGVQPKTATCPAGSHPDDRSAEGALDLVGNVAEWVSDKTPDRTNPSGPRLPVARGGSFYDEAEHLLDRRPLPPSTAHVFIGFRCALDAPDGYVPPAPPEP